MKLHRILLAVKGVNEEQQALLHDGGRMYDQITGKDKDGAVHTLFFDVSAPFEGLGGALQKGESK
jgi:hypothetical protein